MDFNFNVSELEFLRRLLHQNAELSGHEINTTKILHDYLLSYQPDELIRPMEGCGLIAAYHADEPGPVVGVRADIDALPIPETIELDYGSNNADVSHKCGHDGHTVMVMGLAQFLFTNRPKKGSVYLIFQAAEETGEGAEKIVRTLQEKKINVDYIFGLHNLPKYPLGEVVSTPEVFAAASTGVEIFLKGKTSHAAEPENGQSPALALSALIDFISNLPSQHSFQSMALATVVHVEMGAIAFGTNPGAAELRATLRANLDQDLQKLISLTKDKVQKEASKYALQTELNLTESFHSTENSEETFDLIKKAAEDNDFHFYVQKQPFKWSEDFGQYKSLGNTAFFGLGAGVDMPDLHNETYDFPNALIPYGLKMYVAILKNLSF